MAHHIFNAFLAIHGHQNFAEGSSYFPPQLELRTLPCTFEQAGAVELAVASFTICPGVVSGRRSMYVTILNMIPTEFVV
jgi:hypothetical protein